jgi:hypothetical protein
VRDSFRVRKAPVSVRATVTKVTDEFGWEVQDDEGFAGFSSGRFSWCS